MLIHAHKQGSQEAAGESVGSVEATAIGNANPLHRQALFGEPQHLKLGGSGQIPGTSALSQQYFGGEIVAFGVSQAQQVVHRSRWLLVQQHRIRGQGGAGRHQ